MKFKNTKAGFTLIELLVAMGLFLVVIVLATGTFIRALRIQRQAVDLIAMNDSANLALEQMSREIRTGSDFSSPNSDSLNFINASSKQVSYRFNSSLGVVERNENGGTFESITESNVLVAKLSFILQSRVTIVISVASRSKNLDGIFTNLQTTISPRTF